MRKEQRGREEAKQGEFVVFYEGSAELQKGADPTQLKGR